jgi:hypothetical protein
MFTLSSDDSSEEEAGGDKGGAVERGGLRNVGMAAPTFVVQHQQCRTAPMIVVRLGRLPSVFATEKKPPRKFLLGPKVLPLPWIG